MAAEAPGRVNERAGDQENSAGAHEACGDHEDQGDDDGGRVAEACEGVFGVDSAQHHAQHQGGEGNKVIAETSPEQENKDTTKEGKQDNLISRHEGRLAGLAFPARGD